MYKFGEVQHSNSRETFAHLCTFVKKTAKNCLVRSIISEHARPILTKLYISFDRHVGGDHCTDVRFDVTVRTNLNTASPSYLSFNNFTKGTLHKSAISKPPKSLRVTDPNKTRCLDLNTGLPDAQETE